MKDSLFDEPHVRVRQQHSPPRKDRGKNQWPSRFLQMLSMFEL